jgi:hypothetical protein
MALGIQAQVFLAFQAQQGSSQFEDLFGGWASKQKSSSNLLFYFVKDLGCRAYNSPSSLESV